MTTYHYNDDVKTKSGSRATFQHYLPAGYCEVWIAKANWHEPDDYPFLGTTAPKRLPIEEIESA